jgi:hypothetical protein
LVSKTTAFLQIKIKFKSGFAEENKPTTDTVNPSVF